MKLFARLSIVLAFGLMGYSASAQKPTTALELNNYFASINDTLYAGGREWGAKLNSVVNTKAFDSLVPIRMKMERFIKKMQSELKTMKDIKGSDAFRLAMLDFLAFESNMMKEAFLPIESFNSNSKKEDIRKAIDNLLEMAKDEDIHLKKVNIAQNEYAAKNGFKIAGQD